MDGPPLGCLDLGPEVTTIVVWNVLATSKKTSWTPTPHSATSSAGAGRSRTSKASTPGSTVGDDLRGELTPFETTFGRRRVVVLPLVIDHTSMAELWPKAMAAAAETLGAEAYYVAGRPSTWGATTSTSAAAKTSGAEASDIAGQPSTGLAMPSVSPACCVALDGVPCAHSPSRCGWLITLHPVSSPAPCHRRHQATGVGRGWRGRGCRAAQCISRSGHSGSFWSRWNSAQAPS